MTIKKYVYNVDQDVIEIELNDREIEKLILELSKIRKDKTHSHINFNGSRKELLIHHEEDSLK